MIEIPGKNTGKSIMPNPVTSPDETRQLNMLVIPNKRIVPTPNYENILAGKNITKTPNGHGTYKINSDLGFGYDYQHYVVNGNNFTIDAKSTDRQRLIWLDCTTINTLTVNIDFSSANLTLCRVIVTTDQNTLGVNIGDVTIDGVKVRDYYMPHLAMPYLAKTNDNLFAEIGKASVFSIIPTDDENGKVAFVSFDSQLNSYEKPAIKITTADMQDGDSFHVVLSAGESTYNWEIRGNGVHSWYGDEATGFQLSQITGIVIGQHETVEENTFVTGADIHLLNNTVNYQFNQCSNLTNVSIPTGVTSIPDYAFYKCTSLSGFTIQNTVTSIGNSAFFHTALTSVTIPDSVTSIGNNTFAYTPLQSVVVPDSVLTLGNGCFEQCTQLSSVTLPSGLTAISESLFKGDELIESIIIPSTVTSIGKGSFGETGLTTIVIPDSVTTIGDDAFAYTPLIYAKISSNLTSLGAGAFANCNDLETVIMSPLVPPTIGTDAFNDIPYIYVGAGSVAADDEDTVKEYQGATGWGVYTEQISSLYTHWHTQRVGTMIMRDDNTFWDKYEWNSSWNNRAAGVTFADTNGHNMLIGSSDLDKKEHYSDSVTQVIDLPEIKSEANAILDFGSTNNTDKFIASYGDTFATGLARSYNWLDNGTGDLVSCGQLNLIMSNATEINQYINLCGGTSYDFDSKTYWTSSYYGLYSSGICRAWYWSYANQDLTTLNMNNRCYVRPVRALAAINI